jgi:Uri superfamily endonuclease
LKGVYALIIHLTKDVEVNVGALRKIPFKKGLYTYVGSAQNNLELRIKRHLRKEKRLFWHIDYLLNCGNAEIVEVFHKQASKSEECTIASEINRHGEAIFGFGCSDCRCRSHLFSVENGKFLTDSMRILRLEEST